MTSPTIEPTRFDKVTVLVVEDEPALSIAIGDMLKQLGCSEIWYAGDEKRATALLREKRPDAVILDINLAGRPSYQLGDALNEAGIPFVVATSYGRSQLPAHWSKKLLVSKPFQIETLAAALRTALESNVK